MQNWNLKRDLSRHNKVCSGLGLRNRCHDPKPAIDVHWPEEAEDCKRADEYTGDGAAKNRNHPACVIPGVGCRDEGTVIQVRDLCSKIWFLVRTL